MLGDAGFFLQHQHFEARKAAGEFEGDGEADHACANDDYVVAGVRHVSEVDEPNSPLLAQRTREKWGTRHGASARFRG